MRKNQTMKFRQPCSRCGASERTICKHASARPLQPNTSFVKHARLFAVANVEIFVLNDHYHGADHVKYLRRVHVRPGRYEDHNHRSFVTALRAIKKLLPENKPKEIGLDDWLDVWG